MKRVLAIDPGTKCGWAIGDGSFTVWGTWDLTPDGGPGSRFLLLQDALEEALDYDPDVVVYERVRRHLGTQAAHVYGGIVGVVMAFFEFHDIKYVGVPVQTIKSHATGSGRASKEDIMDWAESAYGKVSDDNQADALALLDYTLKSRI